MLLLLLLIGRISKIDGEAVVLSAIALETVGSSLVRSLSSIVIEACVSPVTSSKLKVETDVFKVGGVFNYLIETRKSRVSIK